MEKNIEYSHYNAGTCKGKVWEGAKKMPLGDMKPYDRVMAAPYYWFLCCSDGSIC